ncbi:translation initiation factor IF-3 [Candidatus Poribacteria bacterium]|nr:translation initiation factor IF-3 [Candidatus Poribacteria bacterium]
MSSILAKDKVRLIGSDSKQVGVMPPRDALNRAKREGLDLVMVAPKANPPVCKIVDYGKYKYEQNKREKAKKQSQKTVTKEIKLSPATAEHDYQFKKDHAEDFLKSGAKVIFTIIFRGRQRAHPELGRDLLKRMANELKEIGEVLSPPKMSGYNMSMVMIPKTSES